MKIVPDRIRFPIAHRSQEAAAYLLDAARAPADGQRRVVVFAQGRTGSNLLESLLSSTGHFRRNGELLGPTRSEIVSPLRFVRGLAKQTTEHFIFRVKVYHLGKDRKRPVDARAFLERLHAEDWKVIYLRRTNKVRHALSNIVAVHRGDYHKFGREDEPLRVTVKCSELVWRVNGRLAFEAAEREALRGRPHHEVIYEDDLADASRHQATADRVLDYLGLEPRPVSTRHRKVNDVPLSELITNYDAFVDCVEAHGWGGYLR